MSSYEKEQILRQHKGGKKIFVENFNKLVNNKLGSVNPLLMEQNTANERLTKAGYAKVNEINLSDGDYIGNPKGYEKYAQSQNLFFASDIHIYDKSGKHTGYIIIKNNPSRSGYADVDVKVTGKQTNEDGDLYFKDMGYKPTQQTQNQTQTLTNKVATEGLKNVLPAMIQSPPFDGYYSGYVISGTFNGVNYSWDLNGVEGMMGIRGSIDGQIETENNTFLTQQYGISDANPKGVWVGFNGGTSHFACYQTTDNKIKCVNL